MTQQLAINAKVTVTRIYSVKVTFYALNGVTTVQLQTVPGCGTVPDFIATVYDFCYDPSDT